MHPFSARQAASWQAMDKRPPGNPVSALSSPSLQSGLFYCINQVYIAIILTENGMRCNTLNTPSNPKRGTACGVFYPAGIVRKP
jgi:hypothetical protein